MFASEIADKIGGEFLGPGDPKIESIAPLEQADAGQIAFLHNARYKRLLTKTKASCVVLSRGNVPDERDFGVIVCGNPHKAMGEAVELLYPKERFPVGIHPKANIDPSVTLGNDVSIGPLVSIYSGCVIGDGSSIGDGCVLMSGVHIGPNCIIYPNVTIYSRSWLGEGCIIHSGTVLGSDGFGFAPIDEGIIKVRQVGRLIIEQDVEIGACCTIDRGSFTETRIGRGTKIDNMVHVGHNCRIGEFCLIAAQTGLAGSTEIGNRVMVGGQVGFAGHQKIGDGCIFFAKSGINGDIPPGSKYFGYPAKDHIAAHRETGYVARLGNLFKRVKELEKKLEEKEDN